MYSLHEPFTLQSTDAERFRDAAPNKYMVVMKFRDSSSTQEFYRKFNGKPFSSMEASIISSCGIMRPGS
jgi:hypothetical protein